MQLRDIAIESVKRRPTRGAFVVTALALGIGTLVALVSLTRAMQSEISDELDRFGANIVITPTATTLDLAYGNVDLGGVTVDAKQLTGDDAAVIRTIPNKRNISAVAPKLTICRRNYCRAVAPVRTGALAAALAIPCTVAAKASAPTMRSWTSGRADSSVTCT